MIQLLVTTALGAAIAFLLGLLLKVRLGILALVGAGLFGTSLGAWLLGELKVSEPLALSLGEATYPVLGGAVGVAIVVLLARVFPALR